MCHAAHAALRWAAVAAVAVVDVAKVRDLPTVAVEAVVAAVAAVEEEERGCVCDAVAQCREQEFYPGREGTVEFAQEEYGNGFCSITIVEPHYIPSSGAVHFHPKWKYVFCDQYAEHSGNPMPPLAL